MLRIGFVASEYDPCLFIKSGRLDKILITVHVDDILIAAKDPEDVADFKKEVLKSFKARDLGEATTLLGITVNRDRAAKKIYLTQPKHISKLAKEFEITGIADLPMTAGIKLSKDMAPSTLADKEQMETLPYKSLLGVLMYIANQTRPDITYAVHRLAKYGNDPGMPHWEALVTVARYVVSTQDTALVFDGSESKLDLVGYSDADWAGDVDERRSTSGIVIKLGNASISWSSRQQNCVTLSSAEAEYLALGELTKEVVWIRKVLRDCGIEQSSPTTLYSDNQAAIALAKKDAPNKRTKHIDVKFKYIYENIERKNIAVEYKGTKEMVADALTKAVSKESAKMCASGIGLRRQGGVLDMPTTAVDNNHGQGAPRNHGINSGASLIGAHLE